MLCIMYIDEYIKLYKTCMACASVLPPIYIGLFRNDPLVSIVQCSILMLVAGSIQVCASLRCIDCLLVIRPILQSPTVPFHTYLWQRRSVGGWRNLSALLYVFPPHVALLEGMSQADNSLSDVNHCNVDE